MRVRVCVYMLCVVHYVLHVCERARVCAWVCVGVWMLRNHAGTLVCARTHAHTRAHVHLRMRARMHVYVRARTV